MALQPESCRWATQAAAALMVLASGCGADCEAYCNQHADVVEAANVSFNLDEFERACAEAPARSSCDACIKWTSELLVDEYFFFDECYCSLDEADRDAERSATFCEGESSVEEECTCESGFRLVPSPG